MLTYRVSDVSYGDAREYENPFFVDQVRLVMNWLDKDAILAGLYFQGISR